MPVSGHEETGVKSFAGQFSGLTAGVPIKKRRFPLIHPPSPRTEEPSPSLIEETELRRKENSSTSQGSTLSNVSIAGAPIKKRRFPLLQASSSPLEGGSPTEESDALRKEHSCTSQGSTLSTSSSALSDANGYPVFEERKAISGVTNANMVQNNSCFIRSKLEEPNLATQSCSLDVMGSKEKVLLEEGYNRKIESEMIKENSELMLASKESLARSTSLSLCLNDHLFPAVGSTKIDEMHLKTEKAEPVSLELSLSKEECRTRSVSNDAKSNSDLTHVHSNRANWDLNTTMDAWEESGTDASSVKTTDASSVKASVGSYVKASVSGCSHDKEQFMSSTGMAVALPTGVVSVRRTCEERQKKSFLVSSGLYGQQYKCVDPHNLSLASALVKHAEEPSSLSANLNSLGAITTVSMSSMVTPAGSVNNSSFRLVKSEPVDENLKNRVLKDANVSTLDCVAVKQEFVYHSSVESSKMSNVSNLKLVDPKVIKSEPCLDGNQERPTMAESKTDQFGKEFPLGSDNCSSSMALPVTLVTKQTSAKPFCPPVKPMCSAELTTNENLVSQLEDCSQTGVHVEKVSTEVCSSTEQVPLVTVAMPMVNNGTELSDSGMKDFSSIVLKEGNADDRDSCKLKLMNEPPPDQRDSGEGCVSDEEKITLSADMLEDDSYSSDCVSDDNHAVNVAVDTEQCVEDDDYEDGEVREPLEHSTVEDTVCEVREVEHPDCDDYEHEQMEKGMVSSDCPTTSHAENDKKTVIHSEINSTEDGVDIEMLERPGKVIDKIVCLQESVDGEKSNSASDCKRAVNLLQRKPLDLSERIIDSTTPDIEFSSNQATKASLGVDAVQTADEVVKTTDTVMLTDLDLPRVEVNTNSDDATKDVSNGGNQGRIIDLSRAACSSSPGKTRPISGRSLPSRAGRDVLSDTFDGDKIHRGRDESYIDAPRKFSRERHQDMSPRNSRMNFVRGRGRVNSRLDSFRGEWESDREFSGEFYNGPSQFRGPRPKYASANADSDMEYNNVPDGSYAGHGRIGRKPLNDGSYIASRRRSPGVRDGIQMAHRIPRTISPNRCIGGDGSELGGIRHSDKFMRGFPDDSVDSMFTRSQPFEGLDNRFSRGGRNFSSIQRRGPPGIRSKSPIRSRSRSPGVWSSPPRRRSPRRRSPEGFGGHPDMSHRNRRSPIYRVERVRSPDRPVFPGDRVVRRHDSPSYMSRPSNDIRDMESARNHGHPRPVFSNRSPSGRILIRSRRFDVVDPRDRSDNDDDYFGGGPMHSGRLIELSGEGNGEERRRFGERRGGHVRSFRPPYNNGNVGENFHLNAEDGPRHFRFCSDDSDFHERGNMRERDFDRRIKGRPSNVPPRRRNMDEQEENFRHGGQVWSDDSFEDISRVKRKRF